MSTLYNFELSNLVISTDDDVHKGGETNSFDKLYSALSTIRHIIQQKMSTGLNSGRCWRYFNCEKGHQLSEEKDNNLLSEVHIATFIPFSLNLELRMTKQQ